MKNKFIEQRKKIIEKSKKTKCNELSNIAFPLIRKTFSTLNINSVVSAQPMNVPSGLLFYLDYDFPMTQKELIRKKLRTIRNKIENIINKK